MGRSVMLGIVGDSAAGKTTLSRGIERVLGEDKVTHICVDDYHRYDRRQRAERNITPLNPDCNYMDIMAQHLAHLMLLQALRIFLDKGPDGGIGWIYGLADKQVGAALNALHGDPAQRPMDRGFIALLFLVSLTGLALLVGRDAVRRLSWRQLRPDAAAFG